MRNRIYSQFTTVAPDNETIAFNVGNLLEDMLLFEYTILSSVRLRELPFMISHFGFEGVRELVKSGYLKIHCEALSLAEIGQAGILEARAKKGVLPFNSYSFGMVQIADEKKYFHDCFKVVNSIEQLQGKQSIKLKEIIASSLVKYPSYAGSDILSQFKQDMKVNDINFILSLCKIIKDHKNEVINPDLVQMIIHPLDEDDFRVETNLNKLLCLSDVEEHELVKKALLGVAGSVQRILLMKHFDALTSFKPDEVSLFESKVDAVISKLKGCSHRNALRRVLNISNFPDLGSAAFERKIDIDKFMKIRQSEECKAFREWIWRIDGASDAEIDEHIHDFRHMLGELIKTPLGKSLRWIAGIGLGFVPDYGLALSGMSGLVDMFLLEKVLPVKGALVFLNKKLPSVFRE